MGCVLKYCVFKKVLAGGNDEETPQTSTLYRSLIIGINALTNTTKFNLFLNLTTKANLFICFGLRTNVLYTV